MHPYIAFGTRLKNYTPFNMWLFPQNNYFTVIRSSSCFL